LVEAGALRYDSNHLTILDKEAMRV
jgi:hypothetical protein